MAHQRQDYQPRLSAAIDYQRQSKHLENEASLRAGLINVAEWLAAHQVENVVLEVANEFPHKGFVHQSIRSPAGHASFLALVKRVAPSLLVTSSGYGDGSIAPEVAEACDFLTPHWNGIVVERIPDRIAKLKRFNKPIVCNEDDKVGEVAVAAMQACVAGGVSYGLMLKDHNQTYPFHFDGAADDPVFYAALKAMTRAERNNSDTQE
jgi:hypothetical protein